MLSAMRLLWRAITSLSLCCSTLGDPNNKSTKNGTSFLNKRWYSVPEYPGKNQASDPFIYPWPVACTNPYVQPIYYCFNDQRSARHLEHIVNGAVKNWAHAMQATALTIELDPRAREDPKVTCDQLEGDKDALVISDESIDEHDVDNQKDHFYSADCQTQTTVGYTYAPKTPYRHTLKFCELAPWNPKADTQHAIRAMTHELGHAIGLQHEHQRPDRNTYLWVDYRNLEGWDQLQDLVKEDPNDYFPADMPIDQRIRAVKQDDIYMHAYFPSALPFLPGDRFLTPSAQDLWTPYTFSTKFDYESIMLYDSTAGLSDKARSQGKYTIFSKKDRSPVWMGGSKDFDRYSISEGDIARVAMLYDAHDEKCEAAKRGEIWKEAGAPKALRVRIRDVFDGVAYAPRAVREKDEI